ncbi:MAG: M16 family metallopeptidase [Saprospiraceae bacterium]
MKRTGIFLSLMLFVLVGVQAQMNKIEFEEYTLDNGLHVILHQDKSTPIVTVSVMYHVGSKNENPNRTGFAHFFEHLLFEGSENIERGQFDKYIQNAGGFNNANTTHDRTYYYEVMASNHLATGLWLESERMLHAKVENKGIETQRQVVKEERRQRIDNQPYMTFMEQTFKRAYKKHPYRWSVIGSMDHLDAAQEKDYKSFYKTFYVPNNAVLSIAGDIDMKETKMLIDKYFKGIPRGGKIPRPTVVEPPLMGEIRDTIYDNVQLPGVFQAYRIPAQGTDEYYAVDMLGKLMTNGQSSRLYRSLVDDQQKALVILNFPFEMENPGLSYVIGLANMGIDPMDLEKAIDAEIKKVQTDLITDAEFQKLRNQIENDFVNSNASIAGRAESLANYHMYFGDANLINNEIDRYLSVTKEDLRNAAKKYFTPSNRVVLYYLAKPTQP